MLQTFLMHSLLTPARRSKISNDKPYKCKVEGCSSNFYHLHHLKRHTLTIHGKQHQDSLGEGESGQGQSSHNSDPGDSGSQPLTFGDLDNRAMGLEGSGSAPLSLGEELNIPGMADPGQGNWEYMQDSNLTPSGSVQDTSGSVQDPSGSLQDPSDIDIKPSFSHA